MQHYIKFEKAKQLILSSISPLEQERVHLKDSLFRVIAEDCISKHFVPGYNNSAMDGFAVRSKDTLAASKSSPVKLKIVSILPAGEIKLQQKMVFKKSCVRIMTGSVIPEKFDAVIEKESVKEKNGYIYIYSPVNKYKNIRFKGEDIKKGEVLLRKGTLIDVVELGNLISSGYKKIKVYKVPRVGIIATGNELVDIDENLTYGKVKNVNSYTLSSLVKKCHCVEINCGIVKDEYQSLKNKILSILNSVDVLLISGGVSYGEYDIVKPVLLDIGVKPLFWEVKQRPGKPVFYGVIPSKKKYIFGIPGNVVSNIVVFEMLIKPALLKLAGRKDYKLENYYPAILEEQIKVKPGLKHFLRGIYTYKDGNFYVKTTGEQGSGILKSMLLANCFIVIDGVRQNFSPGEKVKIYIL